jgi:hypothetical protein
MGCIPSISSTHGGELNGKTVTQHRPLLLWVNEKAQHRVMNEAQTRELPKLGTSKSREAPHRATSFSGLGTPHIFHQPRWFLLPYITRLLQRCRCLSPQPRVYGC